MPTKSLQATIFGVDKASPVFDKVGKSATGMANDTEKSSTRMGNAFSKGAKMAAGALAAIGFTQFVTDSVKAFTEAQAQTQKLIDAYDKFPAMRDVTVQSFQDISSSLMNVTKFDDDATNAAAALLGQFGLTGTQIQKLIPLVQDYATATGKDLNTSATDLGKALLGQTRALKEVGINYKSTGDKATDFTNITQLLRDKVGGFAENEGKTAAGQLEILKNQFGEVQEKIGSALVPALTELGKIAIPILEGIGTGANLLVTIVEKIPGPVKLALGALIGFKIFQQTAVFEKLTTGARGFRDEMVLQRGLAAAEGVELSNMGAAASVAKTRVAGLAGTLAKGGALAGGLVVLSMISDAFGKIKERQGQVEDATRSLTDALVESGGAWTDAAKQARIAGIEGSDAFKQASDAGISYATIMDGITGSDQDWIKLASAMKSADLGPQILGQAMSLRESASAAEEDAKQKIAWNAQQERAKVATGELSDAMDEQRAAAVRTSETYAAMSFAASDLGKAQDDARSSAVSWRQQWDILASKDGVAAMAQRTADKVRDTAAAMQDANSKAHDLSSAASDLELALAKLAGRTPTVEEAQRAYNGVLAGASSALKLAAGDTGTFRGSLDSATGSINTSTVAGQKLYDWVTSAGKAAQDTALAQASLAGEIGGTDAAAKAASASLASQRAEFEQSAKQAGLTGAEIQKLADRYFGLPSQIETVIRGKANFADVDAKIQALADNVHYVNLRGKVTAIDGPAAKGSGPMQFRASGGPVGSGRYLVGERGPELLDLAPGSRGFVHNNSALSRMASMLSAAPRAAGGPVTGSALGVPDVQVRVFIGDQELRGMVRTEIGADKRQTLSLTRQGVH
ncbi:MAG: hypothetical protein BGO26_10295 [Actinobacteria bacterium 69-20]|nr:hypothetical protein [Actinomycetota bacterium]OJV23287.1 MAG: hypothetical protein BGO26_10295 [Actinobacteria bacterium 69-20]